LELSLRARVNTGEQEMTWSETIRDREAFTALYRTHQPKVFRFLVSMTGNRFTAAEITQDVFVWLIHNPDRFDPDRGELSAFLLGVARKFLQRRGRDERRLVPLGENARAIAQAPPHEPDSDTEALRAAIAALPPLYREIVVLCDLEGLTYEEASVIAACAIGTVRSRLHRARQFLAGKLNQKGQTQRCAV
jgi:RNA polymerase sigma-70 factor (ECF subfamily)